MEKANFREQCAEHFPVPDGSTLIDVVFNKDGSAFATRTISFDPSNPHMTIDFPANDNNYELKHSAARGAELFLDEIDKEGNRQLTRVPTDSDEYKSAMDAVTKIGFDTLPSCTIE